ncbi:MAG TPA: S41 family peptidase [Polyangiaceae bacterium]|jgi:carboxyl-terminal processing protease|nr:S41 family peptidase [Polyangiaceae bacterium]
MRQRPHALALLGLALAGGGVLWVAAHSAPPAPPAVVVAAPPRAPSAAPLGPLAEPPGESCENDELVRPTGAPAGLTCAQARAVVAEMHARFAADLPSAAPGAFAEGVVSWLDPHGLWSASSDAPTGPLVSAESSALLADILASPDSAAPCVAAATISEALAQWVSELGETFDRASAGAAPLPQARAAELAAATAFEDGDVTTPARELAAELGRRVGTVSGAFGSVVAPFVRAARERYVPTLAPEAWERIVLAAAIRSYVAAVDPHGAWAPLDEEWSLYADDPSFRDDDRLWSDMLRTALGVRVVDQPTPPLELDDLVLSIEGVPTVGLSVEQVEQLARAEPQSASGERSVVVLRQGDSGPRELVIAPPPDDREEETNEPPGEEPADAPDDEVTVEFVPYGRGDAGVVTIRYVGDDLGERLAEVVSEIRREGRPPVGLLLDLRGNGGGSTDGAAAGLGIFLPGAPAFPLLYRGRVTEVLTASAPVKGAEWSGPVAALVDGATASAAEMLAGGLDRYHRGPLLGQRTYGKGCVQEYYRDKVQAGVVRLTTRLYALPDGSPVQRRGLVPGIIVGPNAPSEREADMPFTLEPVPGPDVRVPGFASPAWPAHRGHVGPCADPVVCRALRKAAGSPVAQAHPEPAGRKRGGARPVPPAGR